jgi:predicted MFS family arabinose efflux permease
LTGVAFQNSAGVFFRPAASASVPHLVRPEDLSLAGTLDGLSWSLGLVAGSALGGLCVDALGLDLCFLLDSASFLASAALIRGLPLPRVAAVVDGAPVKRNLADFGELFAELKRAPLLWAALLAKCAWGVGAAQLLLLTTFGERLLGAAAASTGFGLLYAARGLGTACGPAFARRFLGDSDRALITSITVGFTLASLFYGFFGLTPPAALALVCIGVAHAGGSMVWIGSTVLVQRTAPDRVRGRAFALELSLHTLTAAAAPFAAAVLLDAGWAPERLILAFAGLTAALGAAWTFLAWRCRAPGPAPNP